MSDLNPLQHISHISDIMDLNEYMDDPELMKALDLALQYIRVPEEINHKRVAANIAKLSAYALQFRMKYVEYMTWKKGTKDAANFKNTYRSMYDGLDNLVDSLKYLVKTP